MKTQMRDGEKVVKDGAATQRRAFDESGGRLYLTNQRLIFEAHKFNFDVGITEIELSNVKSTQASWTKVLFIPIFPNTVEVHTVDSEIFYFLVFGNREWAAAIDGQRNK